MVVHKCEGSPLPRLQFFLNERPVDLDGCPNGSCNKAQFLNSHAIKGVAGRTFEEVCKPQKQGDSSSLLSYILSPGQNSSWPRDWAELFKQPNICCNFEMANEWKKHAYLLRCTSWICSSPGWARERCFRSRRATARCALPAAPGGSMWSRPCQSPPRCSPAKEHL